MLSLGECLDLRYLRLFCEARGWGGRQGPVLKNSPPNVKPSKTGNEQERQTRLKDVSVEVQGLAGSGERSDR